MITDTSSSLVATYSSTTISTEKQLILNISILCHVFKIKLYLGMSS